MLRCNIKFNYDRFFTTFNYKDIQRDKSLLILQRVLLIQKKKSASNNVDTQLFVPVNKGVISDNERYGDTFPPNSFGITHNMVICTR